MAIQGVGGSVPAVSFRQINVQANLVGKQVTSEKMAEGMPSVSNFGTETNLGTSHFQEENQELLDESVETIAAIMEQDDQFEAPVNGSGTAFSSSGFQELNTTPAVSAAQQQAASAYGYFG